jgi:hypothetical protein
MPNEKSKRLRIWLTGWLAGEEFIDENEDRMLDVVVKYDPFSRPTETNRVELSPGNVR